MQRTAVGRVGAAEVLTARTFVEAGDMKRMLHQLIDAFPFRGGNGHHGNSELVLERVDINRAAVRAHFVHHVER